MKGSSLYDIEDENEYEVSKVSKGVTHGYQESDQDTQALAK